MDEQINELDINILQPNPLQARGNITADSITDLVSSIKEHGILEPLVVAKTPAGYQIIAGERRWRAARTAGLKKVPVTIRTTNAQGMLEMALVENVQREDLNPLERAQAFQKLVSEFGRPISEIAKRVSKSSSYVSNSIRLLNLPDAIKDGLVSGATSEGHARALVGLEEPKMMVEAYKLILTENASVRRTEELIRRIKHKLHKKRKIVERIHSEELDNIAKDIAEKYDCKCRITQSRIEAKVLIKMNGKIEETTEKIRDIHKRIG